MCVCSPGPQSGYRPHDDFEKAARQASNGTCGRDGTGRPRIEIGRPLGWRQLLGRGDPMTEYGGKELAEAFRTVRKNTIQIAEDIPEAEYSLEAAPEVRS